jgi:uncharacterized UBP type Zn finger protein
MSCHHFEHLKAVEGASAAYGMGCEECTKAGDTWVHLRECLICGHVGCCDDSKNRHATKHFTATHHAVMRSVEPGELWAWCYVDEVMAQFG